MKHNLGSFFLLVCSPSPFVYFISFICVSLPRRLSDGYRQQLGWNVSYIVLPAYNELLDKLRQRDFNMQRPFIKIPPMQPACITNIKKKIRDQKGPF